MTTADIRIREIGAGDEATINRLLVDLDAESRRLRWFSGAVDIARAVQWAAHPEQYSAVGLLALADDTPVGHAAIVPLGDGRGEVAFEVAAAWRHHGIAGALLTALIEVARSRGLHAVYADVLPENADMLAVLREHGEHRERQGGGVVRVTLPVTGAHEEPSSRRAARDVPVRSSPDWR